MDKLDALFFINLERRPDRRDHFIQQCKVHNVDFNKITYVSALDGNSCTFTPEQLQMFENRRFSNNAANVQQRMMANQLTHYYILKDIVKKNIKYSIICQDDAIFRPGFAYSVDNIIQHIPENAEIVNLGLHKSAEFDKTESWDLSRINDKDSICQSEVNPYVCHWKPELNPASLSYLVTLNGANNLVNYFETNGFVDATDYNYNHYLIERDIFYGSTQVLATGNPKLGSDIFC